MIGGTSVLRLRLIDADTETVLAETESPYGIAATFELWKKNGIIEKGKLSFYTSVLTEHLQLLEKKSGTSLENVPFIISGMASSNIGMTELPYKEIPFSANAENLQVKIIEAANDFDHTIVLISGVRTTDDIMRGEETQLLGSINEKDKEEQVFIFPGTHSKHVRVKDGKVVDFKTYMTGEFFELLSTKSILSSSVKEQPDLLYGDFLKNFEKGVHEGAHSNLLHSAFSTRTNDVFGKLTKEENYYYLSGLLIGTELKELVNEKTTITIVGNETISKYYIAGLKKLGLAEIKYCNAANAVKQGHCKIYKLYQSNLKTKSII